MTSQEQCLAINTAATAGKITFALRSLTDDGSWQLTSYGAANLQGGPKRESKVSAYVKMEGEDGRGYALVDGKWVRSEVKPSGFITVD